LPCLVFLRLLKQTLYKRDQGIKRPAGAVVLVGQAFHEWGE
jgi:hypothetical protein